MATEAEIIASNVLASAIEYKRLYDTTKKNEYKVKEQRLRQIAENVKLIVSSTSSSSVSSFNGRTGAVTLLGSDVTSALGYTPLASESDTLDSVTDRGSTTPNAINVGGITTDYVQFDTIATPTPVVGMMSWDTDRSTVSVQLDSDVDAHLGQDNFWYVKNQSGATIPKGKAVMAVGTLGASGRILIDEMVANGSVSAKYLLGVTAEDIANGADGFVINIGKLRQTDTSVWPDGTVLYCDASTPGNLTSTKPSSPNLALPIAFVVHSATNGILAIRISTIDENSLGGGSVPTLAQVTTAGNTTTNSITVGGLTVDTDTLVVDATNNRVGINTTTPTERLEVGSSSINNTKIKIVSDAFSTTTGLEIVRGSSVWNIVNSGSLSIVRGGVSVLTASASLNVLIGTTTDAGFKLDVNGTARVLSSSEAVFRVQHTNGNYVTTVLGNGGALAAGQVGMYLNGSGIWSAGSTFFKTFSNNIRGQSASQIFTVIGGYGASNIGNSIRLQSNTWDSGAFTATSGTQNTVLISGGQNEIWQPSSGNATYNSLVVLPIINTTGTYAGIVRGIYYTPTLTSVTGVTHRAIETTSGDVIFNGGQVGIGTSSPGHKLDITVGNVQGLRVQSSNSGFLEVGRSFGSKWRWANDWTAGNMLQLLVNDLVGGDPNQNVLTVFGSTKNVSIGTTTDAGYKLDVNGDVRISGSGSTSGSNALTIRNSSGTSLFRVSNVGFTFIETVSSQAYLQIGGSSLYYVSTTSKLDFNTSVRTFNLFSNVSTGDYSFNITNNTTYTGTVENINHLNIFSTFAPTSGTSTISYTVIRPTINQTGGANGITRGLYVNPTLTSAYDFRAIETSAGKVIHQGLTAATQTNQVYYNTTTGELTYGALPTVATPTLAQVTTAGNTTTNAVTVGGLTVTGMIEVFKVGSSVEFRSLDSNINFLGKSDNTGGVNFYGGGAYNTGGGISVTGNSNLNPSSIYFFRDGFVQNGRFFSSGNLLLGSGSTDAGYKLDVSGTIRSSGVITASGGTSTDWNAAYSWGNHATAGYLTGTTGYTGIFTVPTNPPGQQNLQIVDGLIVNVF